MNKKIVSLTLLIGVLILGVVLFLSRPKYQLTTSVSNQKESTTKVQPSETFKEYSDPSGFSFSYPDNLSLESKEIEDDSIYADIQLFASGINGSLSLKIADSKFKSIDEWAVGTTKQVKLGNLEALEVKLKDRLLLGALDQGVLFTIEMPAVEEDFWMKVYEKVMVSFSFVSPSQETVNASSNEVIFEGEEVVE